MLCTEDKPYYCVTGECVDETSKCLPFSISFSGNNNNADPGCHKDTPHRCFDGSCRAN